MAVGGECEINKAPHRRIAGQGVALDVPFESFNLDPMPCRMNKLFWTA